MPALARVLTRAMASLPPLPPPTVVLPVHLSVLVNTSLSFSLASSSSV